jgi:hypothetical protein
MEICVCSFRKGVSPLNETQCRYIEKLPTARAQEDVEPELENFQAYAMDLDLGCELKAVRF